jgi:hypothetical protein
MAVSVDNPKLTEILQRAGRVDRVVGFVRSEKAISIGIASRYRPLYMGFGYRT